MGNDKATHTQKLNESIEILDKLLNSSNPGMQKAIFALAKIQIRMCNAIIWCMWYSGEKRNESPSSETDSILEMLGMKR